jgi:hypothetical protein
MCFTLGNTVVTLGPVVMVDQTTLGQLSNYRRSRSGGPALLEEMDCCLLSG